MRFLRRRRQGGGSTVFLIFGVIGLFMACGGLLVGVPAGFYRAREVRNLPQPTTAELEALPAGTTVLISAQLPTDVATTDGLALFYIEERLNATPSTNDESTSASDRDWVRVEGTERLTVVVGGGAQLTVQFSNNTSFGNTQEVEGGVDDGELDRRTVGYLPGQTVALEGAWEGNDLFTAKTVYAGTVDDFVTSVGRSPFAILGFSLVCLMISFAFIGVGGAARFLRR